MQAKSEVSLTWDNDRRFLGVNPIVRPDVDEVFRCYIPLGSI